MDNLLGRYKGKLKEALTCVSSLDYEKRAEAVQIWNDFAQQFRAILDASNTDQSQPNLNQNLHVLIDDRPITSIENNCFRSSASVTSNLITDHTLITPAIYMDPIDSFPDGTSENLLFENDLRDTTTFDIEATKPSSSNPLGLPGVYHGLSGNQLNNTVSMDHLQQNDHYVNSSTRSQFQSGTSLPSIPCATTPHTNLDSDTVKEPIYNPSLDSYTDPTIHQGYPGSLASELFDYDVEIQDQCFDISTCANSPNVDLNETFTQSGRPLQQIQQNVEFSDLFEQHELVHQSNDVQDLIISPDEMAQMVENFVQFKSEISCGSESDGISAQQHTCELCGKTGFSTKANLRRHLLRHSGEKPFVCDICNNRFTEKKSLMNHVRRHTGEKPYQCSICSKVFSQNAALQIHMAVHNEKKFKCHICPSKFFRQRSQLRLHLMRHDGIKRLECSTCKYKFLTKGDLERHRRTHTGERPFACTQCDKTFTRQQSLREHLNRHLGRKPYGCQHCDKTFSEKSASCKHAKTHKHDGLSQSQSECSP